MLEASRDRRCERSASAFPCTPNRLSSRLIFSFVPVKVRGLAAVLVLAGHEGGLSRPISAKAVPVSWPVPSVDAKSSISAGFAGQSGKGGNFLPVGGGL